MNKTAEKEGRRRLQLHHPPNLPQLMGFAVCFRAHRILCERAAVS